MANYSRQREAIMQFLRSSKAHPTANAVYENVKKEIPNISLGTVYRNLSMLSESGEILCLHVANGPERYDGDISPHLHLHCKHCGEVADVPLDTDYIIPIANKQGFIADNTVYLAYGVCKHCNQN